MSNKNKRRDVILYTDRKKPWHWPGRCWVFGAMTSATTADDWKRDTGIATVRYIRNALAGTDNAVGLRNGKDYEPAGQGPWGINVYIVREHDGPEINELGEVCP